jgi:hypothetical protein
LPCKYETAIYTWDPEKNRRNIAGHGIAFEDAVRIFEGLTLERVDDRFGMEGSAALKRSVLADHLLKRAPRPKRAPTGIAFGR